MKCQHSLKTMQGHLLCLFIFLNVILTFRHEARKNHKLGAGYLKKVADLCERIQAVI